MSPSEKIIHRSVVFLVALALIALVLPGVPVVSTSTFLKTIVFQVIVEIAFVFWLFLALRHEEFRPRIGHPIVLFLVLFAIALIATLPFSVEPTLSFWSTPDRAMGVFQYLHLFAFFLIAAGTVRTWNEWKAIFLATTAAAVVSDFAAIRDWLTNASGLGRAQGFFVNTLFLAQYTAPHIAIAGILIANARRKWEYVVFGSAFFLHAFVLALTASRAAVLALLAVAVFGALVFAMRSQMRAVRIAVPAAMALGFILLSASVFTLHIKGQAWVYEHVPFVVARMAYPNMTLDEGESILDVQIGDRGSVWAMGVQGFLERPIAGHGFESFRAYFDRQFDPINEHGHLIESNYDRVHNQFLDILFATGLLGFVPYVLFWASLFIVAHWQFDREESARGRVTLFFAIAGVLMSVVQVFFFFDVVGGVQILLCLAAFLYALTPHVYLFRTPAPRLPSIVSLVVVPVVVLMLPIVWRGNILPMEQVYQSASASQMIGTDLTGSVDLFKDSLTPETPYAFWLRFVPLNLTRVAIDFIGVRAPVLQVLVGMNVEEQERSVSQYPDVYAIVHAAVVAHRQAGYFFPHDAQVNLERAEELANRLLDLGPGRVEGYEELGDLALTRGDAPLALKRFNEARERVLWNDVDRGRLDFRIAQAYAFEGDYVQVLIALDSASRLGYSVHYDVRLLETVINDRPLREEVPEAFDGYVLDVAAAQSASFDAVRRAAEYFLIVGEMERASTFAEQLYLLDAGRAAMLEQAGRIDRGRTEEN